jgi:hypothetical protein
MDAENPGRRNVLPGFVVFLKVLASDGVPFKHPSIIHLAVL